MTPGPSGATRAKCRGPGLTLVVSTTDEDGTVLQLPRALRESGLYSVCVPKEHLRDDGLDPSAVVVRRCSKHAGEACFHPWSKRVHRFIKECVYHTKFHKTGPVYVVFSKRHDNIFRNRIARSAWYGRLDHAQQDFVRRFASDSTARFIKAFSKMHAASVNGRTATLTCAVCGEQERVTRLGARRFEIDHREPVCRLHRRAESVEVPGPAIERILRDFLMPPNLRLLCRECHLARNGGDDSQ